MRESARKSKKLAKEKQTFGQEKRPRRKKKEKFIEKDF